MESRLQVARLTTKQNESEGNREIR